MDGFYTCQRVFNIETASTFPPFWLFFNWICKEYNHSGSYYWWDGIILQNSDNDEEQALETFFSKFDEFRKFTPARILQTAIGKTEINFFNSHEGIRKLVMDGEESRIGPADHLYIIMYTGNLGCSCHHHKNGSHINSDYFETIEKAKKNNEREYGPSLEWLELEQEEMMKAYQSIT